MDETNGGRETRVLYDARPPLLIRSPGNTSLSRARSARRLQLNVSAFLVRRTRIYLFARAYIIRVCLFIIQPQ